MNSSPHTPALGAEDARNFDDCVRGGGIAVFPADTVYGVCCDADDPAAARRLYELKGRPPEKPAAVMFFALEFALRDLAGLSGVGLHEPGARGAGGREPELHDAELRIVRALLPGPVTLLLPNRATRYAPACGPDPHTLGLRVPRLPDRLAALRTVGVAVMQSSANLSGQPDARTLADVPPSLLAGADLVLDGGELPGTPSTVLDLRRYAASRHWAVVREGALSKDALAHVFAS